MNKTERKLIGNTDAEVWAKQFVKMVKKNPMIATDEGTMIGWFANAIMSGYDEGVKKEQARDIVDRIQSAVYQAAGAGAGVCLPDNEEFPSQEVIDAVEKICKEHGIPRR